MQSSKRSQEHAASVTARGTGLGSGIFVTLMAVAVSVTLIVIQFMQGGDAGTWVRLLLTCALLCWAGWLFGGFPRIVMQPQQLRIINVMRTFDIPAHNIVDVREEGLLSVEAHEANGEITRIRSWGGPIAKRAKVPNLRVMLVMPDGAHLDSGGGVVSARYAKFMDDDSVPPSEIKRRWNYLEWAILGVLLTINVAIWFH